MGRGRSAIEEAAPAGSRWRRLTIAALVGAAVVVWPAWPGAREARAQQPPPFERALRWSDIIRLRLSPWLLDPRPRRSKDRLS